MAVRSSLSRSLLARSALALPARRGLATLALFCCCCAACTTNELSYPPATTSAGAGGSGGGHTGGSGAASSSTGLGGHGGSGGDGANGSFVLDVRTELDGSALVLRCNLPRDAATCRSDAPAGAPCEDDDEDGLTDAWEGAVLDRLRPLVRFDENESLFGDPLFVTASVGRVTPVGELVHVFLMLGYTKDYGSCAGITSHNGDSERVALELEPMPGGGSCDVRVRRAYTAAHEGTVTDHSRLFGETALDELTHALDSVHGEPRWVVYSSKNKHASYASEAICHGISQIPCIAEDCNADGVANPEDYERLFPFVNAGEPLAPLVTDLAIVGFPGEDAWEDRPFCGSLGGSGCSSSVRSKLVDSPF